jgi:hypothetical protein
MHAPLRCSQPLEFSSFNIQSLGISDSKWLGYNNFGDSLCFSLFFSGFSTRFGGLCLGWYAGNGLKKSWLRLALSLGNAYSICLHSLSLAVQSAMRIHDGRNQVRLSQSVTLILACFPPSRRYYEECLKDRSCSFSLTDSLSDLAI